MRVPGYAPSAGGDRNRTRFPPPLRNGVAKTIAQRKPAPARGGAGAARGLWPPAGQGSVRRCGRGDGTCQDAQGGSVSRFSVRQPMRPALFQYPARPRSLCRVLGLTLGLQPGVEAFFGDLQDEHADTGKGQENNGRPEFIRRHGAAFRVLPRTCKEMV